MSEYDPEAMNNRGGLPRRDTMSVTAWPAEAELRKEIFILMLKSSWEYDNFESFVRDCEIAAQWIQSCNIPSVPES